MLHRGISLWAIISCCVGASPWASAETFALKNGKRIEGKIVRAIGNAITIRREDRGMYQCPLNEVDWVVLTDRQGVKTQGILENWSKGIYFLGTEEGVVAIKDGQIIKDAVQRKRPAAASPRQPVM